MHMWNKTPIDEKGPQWLSKFLFVSAAPRWFHTVTYFPVIQLMILTKCVVGSFYAISSQHLVKTWGWGPWGDIELVVILIPLVKIIMESLSIPSVSEQTIIENNVNNKLLLPRKPVSDALKLSWNLINAYNR